MKDWLKLLMVFGVVASMGLAGCSSSGVDEEGVEGEEDVEYADADTDIVPEEDLAELEGEEAPMEEPSLVDELAESAPEEVPMEEPEMSAPEDDLASTSMDSGPSFEPTAGSGNWVDYSVKSGDTLMKIAFETYGNLYEWRRVYEANRDKIPDYNNLVVGTMLKVETPDAPPQIDRNGTPYLIKLGDTLGTISSDVYGTPSKWKRLWKNNPQLIRDPNKIYAGFYLYYTMTAQDEQEKQNYMSSPMASGGGGLAPAPAAEEVPNFQGATEAMGLEDAPPSDDRAPSGN